MNAHKVPSRSMAIENLMNSQKNCIAATKSFARGSIGE